MSRRRGGYPKYVSSQQKKAKAARAARSLGKNKTLHPVTAGRGAIAASWWGKAWIKNLEGYADYSNRLPRGRSYLRSDTVLDLQIEAGCVSAMVAGSRAQPYEVQITISPLKKPTLKQLTEKCGSTIQNLQALLAGDFPKDLEESFLSRGDGLFPSPKEITFDCSCPDWATMCKHLAAVLYGIAVRLDENPQLFFLLRGIEVSDFVSSVINTQTNRLIKKRANTPGRTLSRADTRRLFGI